MIKIENIETIRRLRAIKPGERIRYFRGTQEQAASSEVVSAVFDYAAGLQLRGTVRLERKKLVIDAGFMKELQLTDFIAIGN